MNSTAAWKKLYATSGRLHRKSERAASTTTTENNRCKISCQSEQPRHAEAAGDGGGNEAMQVTNTAKQTQPAATVMTLA